MRSRFTLFALPVVALALLAGSASAHRSETHQSTVAANTNTLISLPTNGNQGSANSMSPAVSADGRFVAFASEAGNLVEGDNNGAADVFVYDLATALVERVSVASDGSEGDDYSWSSSLSADGRYVAFQSNASNLVADDTNECEYYPPGICPDIFVHDRQTGVTTIVSVSSDGSQGNGSSRRPVISADGRYVAFESTASNLVANDTNECFGSSAGACADIFVHDRQTGVTERVSISSDGNQSNHESAFASISANGRYIAFQSEASNLVDDDIPFITKTFVHDRLTGATERVSVASDGTPANARSESPSISADGRYVAFQSIASNLVEGDTNMCPGQPPSCRDIFVHDRQTGLTERVSVASDGNQANGPSTSPSISEDGRYVAFASMATTLAPGYTTSVSHIYVHDRQTGTTERTSTTRDGAPGDQSSSAPTISADGHLVAFESIATNLVYGDTNNAYDVFVRDHKTSLMRRISVSSAGSQGNGPSMSASISGDGRYVAFDSQASNLVPGDTNGANDVFVHSPVWGSTTRVSVATDGTQADAESVNPHISADASYVAFESYASNLVEGDTNTCAPHQNCPDVFVYGLNTGTTERVSVASDGSEANGPSGAPRLSIHAYFVAYHSAASNLVAGDTNGQDDVFVRDRQTKVTERVSVASDGSEANNGSWSPSISFDGRFVAFESAATNLVPADTNASDDIFVHDRETGLTERVSVTSAGSEGNGSSHNPHISGDGRYIAFRSQASNLVTGDTNGSPDIFVHDRQTGLTERVSISSSGLQGNLASFRPDISAGGRYVTFASYATDLVAGPSSLCAPLGSCSRVFVHDRELRLTHRVVAGFDGSPSNGSSWSPVISGDGEYVAYHSSATNLVPNDENQQTDVFMTEWKPELPGIFTSYLPLITHPTAPDQ